MKPWTIVAAIVFAAVAIVHVWRLASGWQVVIDGNAIPMWASYIGLVVPGLLAVMLLREARR